VQEFERYAVELSKRRLTLSVNGGEGAHWRFSDGHDAVKNVFWAIGQPLDDFVVGQDMIFDLTSYVPGIIVLSCNAVCQTNLLYIKQP
jgi:hypothetical protein